MLVPRRAQEELQLRIIGGHTRSRGAQDSDFHEVRRITNLLLKTKCQAREEESSKYPQEARMLMKTQHVREKEVDM